MRKTELMTLSAKQAKLDSRILAYLKEPCCSGLFTEGAFLFWLIYRRSLVVLAIYRRSLVVLAIYRRSLVVLAYLQKEPRCSGYLQKEPCYSGLFTEGALLFWLIYGRDLVLVYLLFYRRSLVVPAY